LTFAAHRLLQTPSALQTPDPVPVILHLNNEGAEVQVIEAFHGVSGDRLQLMMGSLNGVMEGK